MERGAGGFSMNHRFHECVIHFIWVNGRDPKPLQTRNAIDNSHKISQSGRLCFRLWVSIKIAHVDSCDDNFLVSIGNQPLYLLNNLGNRTRSRAATYIGNDAIGTKRVTPILNLDKGTGVRFKVANRKLGNRFVGEKKLHQSLFVSIGNQMCDSLNFLDQFWLALRKTACDSQE